MAIVGLGGWVDVVKAAACLQRAGFAVALKMGGRRGPVQTKKTNEEMLGVSGDCGQPDGLGAVCADGGGGVTIL